jgi:hypothetical protein
LFYGFVTDSIRVAGMDVEIGTGYQYATLPKSFRNQSDLSFLNVPGLIVFDEPDTQKWNFAPRIGLAWAPTSSRTAVRGSFGMTYDALNLNTTMISPQLIMSSLTNSANNTPFFWANGGVPSPVTAAGGVGLFIPEQEMPYTVHWSGGVSHALFGKLNMEFRYNGNHGVHVPLVSILNNSGRVSAASNLPVFFTNPGQPTLDSLTTTQAGLVNAFDPFVAAGFTNPLMTIRPDGTSWYNAGTVKFLNSFVGGTQVRAQYTYSDLRSDATGTPFDLAFGRRNEQVPWNQKHRAVVSTLFDLGSLLGKAGTPRTIFADFSITGTVTYASTTRIPLFSALNTGLNGNALGSGVFVNPAGTALVASGSTPLTNSSGDVVAFLANNPNAQFVAGGPGTFSTQRPTIRLDDTRNVDLSFVKRFTVKDRAKIEARGDAFNVFNQTQFTGLPVSTLGPGMGMMMTPSYLLSSNPEFNNIRGALSSNPRTIQLALRVIF